MQMAQSAFARRPGLAADIDYENLDFGITIPRLHSDYA